MALFYNVASYRSIVGIYLTYQLTRETNLYVAIAFKNKIELSEGRFPPLFPQMSLETFKNIAVSILI